MTGVIAPPADAPVILVADDVPANVELLFDQLHVLGFRAIAASDGPSALKTCFEQSPDLCILDVSMPAGDLGVDDRSTGFEVCRRIKRDPRTARIPVIFVTALIEDLLEVARLEETRLVLHLSPLAPGALLTEIRHEWEMRFQQERATAVVETSDDAPVIEADHALLKRVFSNLIQNSLSHSAR